MPIINTKFVMHVVFGSIAKLLKYDCVLNVSNIIVHICQKKMEQKENFCGGWSCGKALNHRTDQQLWLKHLKLPTILELIHAFQPSCASLLLCQLPAATTEHSFSALKRIKTYLRSTMNENRLNGFAHLHIHRNLELCHDDVIDEFSKNNRRLNFHK